MSNKWDIVELSDDDEALAANLETSLGLSPVVARLMTQRGITSVQEAEQFLHPQLGKQPDPYLMFGMDRAVYYLERSVRMKRHIMITGDRDVDGVTAVALLHNVLRDVFGYGDYLHYYIPGAHEEGYGISRNCIEEALMYECQLLIVIDMGIKAVEEVRYARELGLEVIICDHHQADAVLPVASAILNPKLPECSYPNPHLSACGVGYKLMQALCQKFGQAPTKLYNYLDLLAVSIAADLVPVIGENRAYLIHGLHQLNSHPSVGMKALLELIHMAPEERIDMGSIVYKIAPRLNAAGRMQNGQIAVDLLTASTAQASAKICAQLEVYNNERRQLDSDITEEAEALIAADPSLAEGHIIVLYQPHWYSGVMGIVAARIAERYKRPTIIMTRMGDVLIGSGRASSPTNLYAAIESCRDILVNFGGHKYAAGLTIREQDLPRLRRGLEYFLGHQDYGSAEPSHTIRVDALLDIEEITDSLERELRLLAPFGLKNERPVFATYRLRDAGGSRTVGREQQHLKLRMTDRYCKHRPLNGIAFNQSQHIRWVVSQQAFGICYTLEENNYHHGSSLLLNVKDIYTTKDA